MTTAIVQQKEKPSLIRDMAATYSLEPEMFVSVVRKTCMPQNATNEDLAALLMVAKQYGLNPITREIYAYPKRGGGIQAVVGIDGWMTLINSQPANDGMTFEDHISEAGKLVAITCRIYRKDRTHPTEVTEYLAECVQDTQPWKKWPARMLRHKAAIQCARYAFGFAGVIDPDEAERTPDVITGSEPPDPDPEPDDGTVEVEVTEVEDSIPHETASTEPAEDAEADEFVEPADDPAEFVDALRAALSAVDDGGDVEVVFDEWNPQAKLSGHDDFLKAAFEAKAARLAEIEEAETPPEPPAAE